MPVHVLVVDDSATMRRIIELTLAGEQISVTAVADGTAALAALRQSPPRLMLIDSSLPGVDGYQLATAVRETPGTSKIGILLLTSAQFPMDTTRARLAQIDDHIDKPFETQALIAKVHELEAQLQRAPDSLIPPLDVPMTVEQPNFRVTHRSAPPLSEPPNFIATLSSSGLTQSEHESFDNDIDVDDDIDQEMDGDDSQATGEGELGFDIPLELAGIPTPPHAAVASSPLPPRPLTSPLDSSFRTAPPGAPFGAVLPPPGSSLGGPVPGGSPLGGYLSNPPSSTFSSSVAASPSSRPGNKNWSGDLRQRLSDLGLSEAQSSEVMSLCRTLIERVAWEVVPDLAESIVREEIRRLTV